MHEHFEQECGPYSTDQRLILQAPIVDTRTPLGLRPFEVAVGQCQLVSLLVQVLMQQVGDSY
jgi:hypothetical protein